MRVYYNEWDAFPAEWLRKLMDSGHIPDGVVDERSILDVQEKDLEGVQQAHFFAGIGGWPLALRIAGWPDDIPVWTGSCPCQPFSCAGKARGVGDERHLWPAFHRLIAERHPPVVFGEQVESKDGRWWLAGVRDDLERMGYAIGAADLCAAGISAPHRRQRLYWVADAQDADGGSGNGRAKKRAGKEELGRRGPPSGGIDDWLGDAEGGGRGVDRDAARRGQGGHAVLPGGAEPLAFGVADAGHGDGRPHEPGRGQEGGAADGRVSEGVGGMDDPAGERAELCAKAVEGSHRENHGLPRTGSFWASSRAIVCRDGKARRIPVEPSLFPLAPRIPGRVGLLRGAGGAIVPQVAAEFVMAYMEARGIAPSPGR